MYDLTIAFWSSTLIDGVVAGWVLFGHRRRHPHPVAFARLTASRTLAAAAVTGIALAAKAAVLTSFGLTIFGLIHLVYLDLFVLLPLVGLAVLIANRWRPGGRPLCSPTRPVRVVAWLGLALAPVGAYATYVEPFDLRLEMTDIPLPPERAGRDPIRIGILADIQTDRVTDYERSAVARLMAQKPDLILLPGDLFHGSAEAFERELPALRELLSPLSARGGVYFVLGNVDTRGDIARVIAGTQVRLLDQEIVRVTIGDRRLTIGGIGLGLDTPADRRTIAQLEANGDRGDIRILVAHRPDAVLALSPKTRIDLVVAGHTHGGQVVVPLLGPPITFTRVPRHVAAGGFHDLGGRRIYVSRGVGCERAQAPRIRFGAPPEIALLTLVPACTP